MNNLCTLCSTPIASRAKDQEFCCQGCKRVSEVLHNMPAEQHKQYILAAQKLGIIPSTDEGPATIEQQSIPEDPQAQKTQRCTISGLACPSCSWVVEQVAESQPGILSANVDYFTESSSITYDMRVTSIQQIQELLTPLGYTLHETDDSTQSSISRKATFDFVASAVITMNLMSIAAIRYAHNLGYLPSPPHWIGYIEFLLVLPVIYLGWLPTARRALAGLTQKAITMDFLITVSVIGIFLLSTTALFAGSEDIYFETCAGLITIFLLSRMIEARLRQRAYQEISNLMRLQILNVRLASNSDQFTYKHIQEIKKGDTVVFLHNEYIPFDGKLLDDTAYVNESVVTGESKPQKKTKGNLVVAGSLVSNDSITITVERTFQHTNLFTIINQVKETIKVSETSLRAADKVAHWFAPAILIIAIIIWFIHALIFGTSYALSIHGWFPAIAVLAVACPCAFSLAGASALTSAANILIKHGFIVKDPRQLELLASIDTIVFDKTGTLTSGYMTVDDVQWHPQANKALLLQKVATMEATSSHPIAKAIIQYCNKHNYMGTDNEPENVQESVSCIDNKGLQLTTSSGTYIVGAQNLFNQVFQITLQKPHLTYVWFGIDKQALGCFILKDPLKPQATKVVRTLTSKGYALHLLSGDHHETASAIAEEIGITEVHGSVSLQEKVSYINNLKEQNKHVAFIGDGTNDAIAMGNSHVSISMEKAADEAINACGFVLAHGKLHLLPFLFKLGNRLKKTTTINYWWAIGFNSLFIPIAGLGLLNPLLAMICMLLSSTFVLYNSLKLRSVLDEI